MRRKDKEIKDPGMITEILEKAEVIRLAMVDGGEPYLVSMNYGYRDKSIYLHCALEGRKIDILRRNNRVAFTVETDVSIRPGEKACDCGTAYKSVFGTGNAFFVENPQDKRKALDLLMEKYMGKRDFSYPDSVLSRTMVIRVDIDCLSGKKSGE